MHLLNIRKTTNEVDFTSIYIYSHMIWYFSNASIGTNKSRTLFVGNVDYARDRSLEEIDGDSSYFILLFSFRILVNEVHSIVFIFAIDYCCFTLFCICNVLFQL